MAMTTTSAKLASTTVSIHASVLQLAIALHA
jgi:hypothetical protein